MKTKLDVAVLTLAILGILLGGLAVYEKGSVSAGGGEEIGTASPVYDFQDHGNVSIMDSQERGTSSLVRDAEGISMNIKTSDLPVGAYSIWWVIFNNPSECTNGKCGSSDTAKGDVPNPAEASVLWATGGIVGPDRKGHFSANLGVGLEKVPGEVLRGPALTKPLEAEVHLVVRFHGSPAWGNPDVLTAQLTTFQGNCDNFPCFMPQSAFHQP